MNIFKKTIFAGVKPSPTCVVSSLEICDGYNHCGDWSDESGCKCTGDMIRMWLLQDCWWLWRLVDEMGVHRSIFGVQRKKELWWLVGWKILF